ncbi:MAG: methyltransferase domain-containing protein [Proteobacteria bacterium]|nr:methyltransferase domain-containing protein [Pseudomonadota bacterium]
MTKSTSPGNDVRQLFDRHAETYSEELRNSLGPLDITGERSFYDRHKARSMRRFLPRGEKCGRILDYGCGTGGVMERIVTEFPLARVAGFDISDRMLAVARERLSGERNVEWVIDPELAEPFDLIVVANVLHHVPCSERVDFLCRVRRCLSRSGRLFVFEHNPFNPLTRKVVRDCPFDRDAELLNPDLLKKCAMGAGMVSVVMRYVMYLPWEGWLPDITERLLGSLPLGAQYMAIFRHNLKKDCC